MNDIQSELEVSLRRNAVTGASLAYWDGQELHTAVAGVRNSVTRDPVTVDTVMQIGSITKIMTAALVMQLVDEGKISLDTPINRYLPELRLKDNTALTAITCRMLLNHTSGIDGEWLPDRGPDEQRIVDALAHFGDLRLLFRPGAMASYCNAAYVIAGALVQTFRNESWYSVIRRSIFEPLELKQSLADIREVPKFRCSIGDLTEPFSGRVFQTSRPFLSPSLAPAGSTVMMSATDIVTVGRALLQDHFGSGRNRILSADSATMMSQPTAAFVCPQEKIGLGWFVTPNGLLYHLGGGPGVNSFLYADPCQGRVLALLTNMDRGHMLYPSVIAPILESWGFRAEAPRQPAGDPINLNSYVGVYENNARRVEVSAKDGQLFMRSGGKFFLYDNTVLASSMGRRPLQTLTCLGGHEFDATSELPGGANLKVKFIESSEKGVMLYLAMGSRLFARHPE